MNEVRIERRAFLGGALGLALGAGRALRAAEVEGPARACLLIRLDGGPSHLDTFDPKPDRPEGGGTRARETSVPGLLLAEHFERLAARAERLAVVRSLHSREGDHERAGALVRTGFTPGGALRHPSLGAVLGGELPLGRALPPWVCLGPEPVGPGYLGVEHAAWAAGPGAGALLASSLGSERLQARRELLRRLEEPFARAVGLRPAPGARDGSARTAAAARGLELLSGPLRAALEPDREEPASLSAYGSGAYAERLRTARRLLEAGVPVVEVVLEGWDDHQELQAQLPPRAKALDRALAALLDELEARDLLARTVILCLGEFGRTPDLNPRGGRDHYPRAFSALLAGGGLRTGQAIGATSPDGREVVARPLTPADLLATVLLRCGLDPRGVRYAGDRPVPLSEGTPVAELLPA